MKAILCLLVLVASACAAEEKKTEKRGVVGLGYGHAPLISPAGYGSYYGHGLGLYSGIGHAGLGISHAGLGIGHAGLGLGYGHGLYGGYGLSSGLYGHGLLGHGGYVAPAPLVSHAYGAPLLGLGHGWH